jgi:beta-galactosidase
VFGWGWPSEWPSWTWPGQEGKPLTVRVYSSCPRARLVLNGRDLGTKETNRETRFTAEWEVPYEAGDLLAVGMDGEGTELARWVLQTADTPAALRLHPDRTTIAADGQDLSFVAVDVLDRRGVLNPNADSLVRFRVTGPGRIVAVCNSDPRSIESFQQPQRKAWRGRCLVIVKAGDEPGEVRLTAEAEGLAPGEATITVG